MTVPPALTQPEPDHFGPSHGYQPRQLLLLGAGHAHVHVLKTLAAHPMVGVRILLVAPNPRQLYSGMVPGFVAGHYDLEDCTIPLEPLVRRGGIRWLQRNVQHIDAPTQTVTLDDGSKVHYDWLSINTGPVQNREKLERSMPGAREHGLFVRPIEAFAALWPKVVDMARTRPLRVAVIGGGAAGFELACAIRHRLPNAAITLVAGLAGVAEQDTARARQRIEAALKLRHITVLRDVALELKSGEVRLGCGATLVCDVPVIATGAQAPAWLEGCALNRDAQGFISVDACQRSTNFSQIFAAGDISTRIDRPTARSGVYAVRAGPALAANLAAAVAGRALQAHNPPQATLKLLSCGNRYAIGIWGNTSFEGRWVWWLKRWIDRRFVNKYRPEEPR